MVAPLAPTVAPFVWVAGTRVPLLLEAPHGANELQNPARRPFQTFQPILPEQRETLRSNIKETRGRVAELGSLSSGAKMAMKIFVKRVFTIFASNASFLRVIANLQN